MPEIEEQAPPESAAHEEAEEAKLEAIETKVEAVAEGPTRPPWFQDMVDAVAESAYTKFKKFAEDYVEAASDAAEMVASQAPVEEAAPPPPPEEVPADQKPERRHRLFARPLKRKE